MTRTTNPVLAKSQGNVTMDMRSQIAAQASVGYQNAATPPAPPTVRSDLSSLMDTAQRLLFAASEIKGRVVGYAPEAKAGSCSEVMPQMPSAREGIAVVQGRLADAERELNFVLEHL